MPEDSFRGLIAAFERAYVINLADRIDRREGAEREFRRVGVEFPSDRVRLHPGTRPTAQGGFYAIGAKGSFYSHRAVLRAAERDRLNNVLIFEDDIAFLRPPPGVISEVIEAAAKIDWDVIYFGYESPSSGELTGPLSPDPPDTIGGHFYAVNGAFITRMADYMDACEARPRDHPLGGPMGRDGAYNHVRYVYPDVRVFLCVPRLGTQRSSRSDIARPKPFDRGVLRPLVAFSRNLADGIRRMVRR